MPLALGMVPEDRRAEVLNHLVADIRNHDYHITAGDIGFHYVVRALTDNGRSDVLAKMLSQTDPPSYGYQLKQGATSLTEAWDANPTSSQNHFMLGHAEEWFYRGLAGLNIDLANPEPRRIVIHPSLVETVDSASASEDTVFGQVRSSWQRLQGSVAFDITVPPGQQATLILPAPAASSFQEGRTPLAIGGAILSMHRNEQAIELIVGSGIYHLVRSDQQ
jgi:hypothetical protein